MNHQTPDSDELSQYLLGKLTSERREEIEGRILLEDGFHQEVEIAEEELLDSYVHGTLTPADRQLFEANYLTSELHRQKLLFALALKKKTTTAAPDPRHLSWGLAYRGFAYASLALVIVVTALAFLNYRLNGQLQQERSRASALAKELEAARLHESGGETGGWSTQDALVLASLMPAGSRGGELQAISVPEGVRAVQFSLQVPADFREKVQVELLNDRNEVITTLSGISPQRIGNKEVIIATLASHYLGRGNYFLRVQGRQPESVRLIYSFNVRNFQ
jgi:hypothetical protein